MKPHIRNLNWTLVAAIILAIGFASNVVYTTYRFNEIKNQLSQKDENFQKAAIALDDKVKNLATILESTLTEEQKKNSDLRNELEDISDSINILERVSVTDRDLLKKYSKTYFLNENYSPLDLTAIDAEYRSPNSSNYKVLSDIWPYLEDLFEDAEDAGLNLRALSAYRSFGTQSALKASYVVTYGAGTANQFSADQGYSEHQLGTTVDFTTSVTGGALEGFDKTPEYKWLGENAHKYGFILSYPAGNTYYKFEPWHWRFVGVELAEKLHDDNMFFYDMEQRVIDTYLSKIFD